MANIFKATPWGYRKPPLGTPISQTTPIARGLIAAWLHNEAGGTKTNDISGKNNPGTLTVNGSWKPGPFAAPAVYFSAGAVTANAVVPTTTAYTWVTWIKGVAAPTTASQSFVLTNGSALQSHGFCWDHTGPSFQQAAFHQNSSGTYFTAKLTSTLAANQWYQVVSTWDGSSIRIYLNGQLQATTSSVTSIKTVSGILYLATGAAAWNGTMDHFLYYNRALSAPEIQQLYLEPFCFMQPGRGIAIPTGLVTTYNETLTESITTADALTALLTSTTTLSQPITPADSVSALATLSITLAEALTLADASTALATSNITLSQSTSFVDVLNAAVTANVTLSESASLADSYLPTLVIPVPLLETITATDSVLAAAILAAPLIEAFTLADQLAVTLVLTPTLAETIALNDSYTTAQSTITPPDRTLSPAGQYRTLIPKENTRLL
ncbi:hypothetical protein BH10PLA2_BH10PLA2_00620 [soil metagenome]